MNFIVKTYDPIEEAIAVFARFNQTPSEQREYSEHELIALAVHNIRKHDQTTA